MGFIILSEPTEPYLYVGDAWNEILPILLPMFGDLELLVWAKKVENDFYRCLNHTRMYLRITVRVFSLERARAFLSLRYVF